MSDLLFLQFSKAENLFCAVPSGSEFSLFFNNYLLGLGFNHVQDDFQHDFSRMTGVAYDSIILIEL